MRFVDLTLGVVRRLLWTIMAVVLFVCAVMMMVYSQWFQAAMLPVVMNAINRPDSPMHVSVGSLRLKFPLSLDAADVVVTQQGDTMLSASKVEARVRLLPLLKGDADVSQLLLERARFGIGNSDSAMMMRVEAHMLNISPAHINLAKMDITLDDALIDGGRVYMCLNPDTTATDTTTSATDMSVKIKQLRLNDFTFEMRMLPTIDTLRAVMPHGVLADGVIDLRNQDIRLGRFDVSGLGVKYIVPDSATIAATPVVPPSESTSPPWTVRIDSMKADCGHALYTTAGYAPEPGFDPGYIQVSGMTLAINNFYNRATDVVVPLNVSGTERCGVDLDAAGTLRVDSVALHLDDFTVNTPDSRIALTAMMGMGDLATDPTVPFAIDADASLGVGDMKMMFPAFKPYFDALPANGKFNAKADLGGSMADLDIADVDLDMPSAVRIKLNGRVRNALDFKNIDGNIALDGRVSNPTILNRLFLSNSPSLGIPALTLHGRATMHRGTASADIAAVTGGGKLALDGSCNINSEGYEAKLTADKFPLHLFLPDIDIGDLTATLTASGQGFDITKASTTLKAATTIESLPFQGYDYSDIDLEVEVEDGYAFIGALSSSSALKVNLTAEGNLTGDTYTWSMSLNGRHIDLKDMHMSDTDALIAVLANGNVEYDVADGALSASIAFPMLNYTSETGTIALSDVRAALDTDREQTDVTLHNRDLHADFHSPMMLDSLLTRFTGAMEVIDTQMSAMRIDVESLQKALPPMTLDVHAGRNNMLTDMLAESRSGFRNLKLSVGNDSVFGLDGSVMGFYSGETALDTVTIKAVQTGPRLDMRGHVGNRPGTFDEWARVDIGAWLGSDHAGLTFTQHDIKGREGFRIGGNIELADSALTLKFNPLNPIIGYKEWSVNADNYIYYNVPLRHIDANLHMKGEGSSLALFTEHDGGHDAEHDAEQEDLILQLGDIHIADWITISPFAPPVKGDLSANLRVNYGGQDINGDGTVQLTDLYYGKQRVGTFDSNLHLSTNSAGMIRASADLLVDGTRTMTLAGNLNDSTATTPFNLDLALISFPLDIVNPFLPSGTAKLSGKLNGKMLVTGDAASPKLNGYIAFDSTAVKLALTATKYTFHDNNIPVKDNIITFKDFAISGVNENPLTINGTVDMTSLMSPRIDLNMQAHNMQLVNTSRAARGADVYGKAFIDLDADIRGSMRFLNIEASLGVLAGTNVTYVMSDAQSVIESKATGDMVKFVNFNDTTMVMAADKVDANAMLMNIDALLTINNGSTINVDLSTDGKNKVVVQAQGSLNYTQTPISADGRLTGRLNINNGHVAYSPPLMSEKLFTFNEGSYVAFNGDIMNPTLNIHATDVVKANITQEGQNSRLVNFDVELGVTGTLNNMNVAFDLGTDDDMTIANELQSMTAEQRANQAMNLLLYKTYTGPGSRGNANLSGNMLYSFLTSQLNSWAANTIKGVDISFGIDQYNQTTNGTTQSTMSYSYQVSKTLFNDRFKIVVGGNYSTDADADENFSQNLISNISFEYFLNRAQTMLVRLFRHTGYESILEGEVTQTGVGFVYKRKINRLRDLLRPGARGRTNLPAFSLPATPANEPSQTPSDTIPIVSPPATNTDEK